MANSSSEDEKSQPLTSGLIDAYICYLKTETKLKNKSKCSLFESNAYHTILNCVNFELCADAPRSMSEEDMSKVKALRKLICMKTFLDKQYVLIPIQKDEFWFLTVIILPETEGKSSLQGDPVLVFLDSKPGATHDDVELLLQHFLRVMYTLNKRQQCNINAKTVYAEIPANENPNKSALFMLNSIKRFLEKPISIDSDKSASVLKNWFNSRDIKLLENYILQSSKAPVMQPVIHKNMTCNSRIVCKNCGHFCKNFVRCEKCNRKHIGSEGFQVVLGSEFDHNVMREFVQKTVKKKCTSLKYPSLSIRRSSHFKNNTTPAVQTASSTSNLSEYDFLGENTKPVEPVSKFKLLELPSDVTSDTERILRSSKCSVTEILDADPDSQSSSSSTSNFGPKNNMPLFNYPPSPVPGVGSVCLLLSDYECLKDGECLNDSVIEFYLKYLLLNELSTHDRSRTHIFNSFFYGKLIDVSLSALPEKEYAEKMHANVKNWTKNVNIFEKEVVIVPINLEFHWIVAIISFYELKTIPKKNATSLKNSARPSSKHARIIIFDSMSGGSLRAKDIPGHLQKYLEMEYLHKYQRATLLFRDCKTYFPEVPQQPNGYDCGIFILQFVESFFKSPVDDFSKPLTDWFTDEEVGNKRQHVADVIKSVMTEQKVKLDTLPDLIFKKKKRKRKQKPKDSANDDKQESKDSDINVDATQSKTEDNCEESNTSDENSHVPDICDPSSTASEIQENFSASGSPNNNELGEYNKSEKREQDIQISTDLKPTLEQEITHTLKTTNGDSQTEQEDGASLIASALNTQVFEKDYQNSTTSEIENSCFSELPRDNEKHLIMYTMSKHNVEVASDLTRALEKEVSPRLQQTKKASQSETDNDTDFVECSQPVESPPKVKNKKYKKRVTDLPEETPRESSQSKVSASSSQSAKINSPKGSPTKLKRKNSNVSSPEISQISLAENQSTASSLLSQSDANVEDNIFTKKQFNRKKNIDTVSSGETSQIPTDSNCNNFAAADSKLDQHYSEIQNFVTMRRNPRRGIEDVLTRGLSQSSLNSNSELSGALQSIEGNEAEYKSTREVSPILKFRKSTKYLLPKANRLPNKLSPKNPPAQSSQVSNESSGSSSSRIATRSFSQELKTGTRTKVFKSSQSDSSPTVKRCRNDKMYVSKQRKSKVVMASKVVARTPNSDAEYITADETVSDDESNSKKFKTVESDMDSPQDSKHSTPFSVNTKPRLRLKSSTQNSKQKKDMQHRK